MLQNKYDVVVVGGGPSGSMAAWEAAKGGASVCMLEKDRDIGYPVRCGEAASKAGIKQFVDIKDSWVAETLGTLSGLGGEGRGGCLLRFLFIVWYSAR